MLALALALVFAGAFALVAGGAVWADRRRLSAARAVRARLAAPLPGYGDGRDAVRLVRGETALSGVAFVARALAAWGGTARVVRALERAGLPYSAGEAVLATAACAAAGLTAGVFALRGLAGGLALAAAAGALPWAEVARRAGARRRAFEAQLPEALDAVVNSLRAGYSFPAALEFTAAEVPAPLGPELARARDEQRLGVDPRAALVGLAERVDTADARMFVTAVLVQRETGGNLADLLANLAALVRERLAFRGRVAALTAEGRMSAIVLALLPGGVFAAMWALNRDYVRPLVATAPGRHLLAAAAVLTVTGYFAMRKLSDVEY